LKRYVMQIKQRDAYLEFSKGLKAKAKISVDDKALEALASDLAKPAQAGTLQLNPPGAKDEKKEDEKKAEQKTEEPKK
jgi:hypothetical protein